MEGGQSLGYLRGKEESLAHLWARVENDTMEVTKKGPGGRIAWLANCVVANSYAVGDQFHDRQDQLACLEILKKTEKDHNRPTEAVQQQMMRSWDMIDTVPS